MATDSGSPGTDAGHTDAGGGTDSGTLTDSGPATGAVAMCQASVDAVRAACVAEDPSSNRLCIYDALRPLCASGRTAFVKTVFDCLMMDACQSPGDPSGATACVQAAIAAMATANDRALGMAVCACDGSEPNCSMNLPAYTLANTMMLNDGDVASLTSCITNMGCAAESSCEAATGLSAAAACP